MRKFLKYIAVFVIGMFVLAGNGRYINAASASLTGPETVRAGDTITLTLNISDSGKYGLEGTLKYDSSQVTFSGTECRMSGWKVEHNGNSLIVYDDNMSNPINGSNEVLVLKFKINSDIAPGTKVSISVNDILTTDGNEESRISSATYSVTIASALSGNANLASLSVAGFSLSPSFGPSTTWYTLGEVDYSVSKLDISYTTEESSARVSVSKNTLNVGSNTITITVTAENGTTKSYTISVTRKPDPNYKQNSNAALKDITVSMGILSPTFHSDVGEYVVYLPFECVGKTFKATGSMVDAKAQGANGGTIDALVEGVNKTTIVGVAEDGTEKSYTITVVVMPKYEGGEPETIEPTPDGDADTGTGADDVIGDVNSDTEVEDETDKEQAPTDNDSGRNIWTSVLLFIIIVILGLGLIYVLFFWGKQGKR